MLTDFNYKVYKRHLQRLDDDKCQNNSNPKPMVLNFKTNTANCQPVNLNHRILYHDKIVKETVCENVAQDLQLELDEDLLDDFNDRNKATAESKPLFTQIPESFSPKSVKVVPTQMSLFNNSPLMDLSSQGSQVSSLDDDEGDLIRLERIKDDVRKICLEKSSVSINIDKEMKIWKTVRSNRIFVVPHNNVKIIPGISSERSREGFIIQATNDSNEVDQIIETFVRKEDIWFLMYILSSDLNIQELVTFSLKELTTHIVKAFGFSRSSENGLAAICSITSLLLTLECVDLQVCHAYLNRILSLESINNAQIITDGNDNDQGIVHEYNKLLKIYDVEPDQNAIENLTHTMLQEHLPSSMLSEFKHISSSVSIVIGTQLEYVGLRVDMDKWKGLCHQLALELKKLEQQCNNNFNNYKYCLTSPLALRQILYDKLKLPEMLSPSEIREAGIEQLLKSKSTAEPVLLALLKHHELPQNVLRYRRLSKLKSIYCDSLEGFLQSDDVKSSGRFVIGHWEHLSCVTGRIYCSKPNLQALPRDNDGLPDSYGNVPIPTKSMFVASLPPVSLTAVPSQVEPIQRIFLSADFCQIELRLFAHLSNDAQLIQLFKEADSSENDLFNLIAKQIWPESSANEYRQHVKRLVYAIMYGSGSSQLASSLSMSPKQLDFAMKRIRAIMPQLSRYTENCKHKVVEQGWLETITGRRRKFTLLQSDKKATLEVLRQMTNYTIQGSAADICKYAMVQCSLKIGLRGLSAILVLSRHDELVWQVPITQMVEVVELVNKYMTILEFDLAGFRKKIYANTNPDENLFPVIDTNNSKTDINLKSEVVKLAVPLKVRLKRGASLDKMEEMQLE